MANGASSEDDLAERLGYFFAGWNAASPSPIPVTQKWSEFFGEWQKHTSEINNAKDSVANLPEPSNFQKFAASFSDAFREYRESGMMFNVWRAAQLGTDERRNCSTLASLLDHSAEHGQGSEILSHLLSMVGLPDFARRAASERYYTRTEVWPLGDPDSRIDIEIESDDFLVFIEAKIAAEEAAGQLKRYVELARLKAGHRHWAVIYLTPNGRNTADLSLREDGKIKSASWSQVSSAVRSYILGRPSNPMRHLLLQYAEFADSLR